MCQDVDVSASQGYGRIFFGGVRLCWRLLQQQNRNQCLGAGLCWTCLKSALVMNTHDQDIMWHMLTELGRFFHSVLWCSAGVCRSRFAKWPLGVEWVTIRVVFKKSFSKFVVTCFTFEDGFSYPIPISESMTESQARYLDGRVDCLPHAVLRSTECILNAWRTCSDHSDVRQVAAGIFSGYFEPLYYSYDTCLATPDCQWLSQTESWLLLTIDVPVLILSIESGTLQASSILLHLIPQL